MSRPFPPRARLIQVARALAAHLPAQLGDLLDAPRFAAESAVLGRIAAAADLETVVAGMPESEADALAERLLDLWGRVALPALDPAAAIVGPAELWVAADPVEIALAVAVWGIEDGWEAEWSGAVSPEPEGTARLVVRTPAGDAPCAIQAGVRIFGRAGGRRGVFPASYRAAVRRVCLCMDDARRRLLLRDQTGTPGAGVSVEIAGDVRRTGADGSLTFEDALRAGDVLCVGGCHVRF